MSEKVGLGLLVVGIFLYALALVMALYHTLYNFREGLEVPCPPLNKWDITYITVTVVCILFGMYLTR